MKTADETYTAPGPDIPEGDPANLPDIPPGPKVSIINIEPHFKGTSPPSQDVAICPGGEVEVCVGVCPGTTARVYGACVQVCRFFLFNVKSVSAFILLVHLLP